jgi:hypothetical protein
MPAHQRYRYRTTTGSVPQLRGPKIGHSTFQTVAPPLIRREMIKTCDCTNSEISMDTI